MVKRILGLDLGTNSIGWALVEIDHENKIVKILGLGSRILPMDAGEISTFDSGGVLKSSASQKTTYKTIRKLNERFLLRRDRLHCVLNLLKTLPKHYQVSIDFENEKGFRSGKFKKGVEVKLAYTNTKDQKPQFLFMDSYNEMVEDFRLKNPSLFYNRPNGKETKIPYDWTLYYLRKKALTKEITKEELAWITLSFNQKRGYEKTIGQDEKVQRDGELSETFIGIVKSVSVVGERDGLKLFEIVLVDDKSGTELYRYKEESLIPITQVNDLKEYEVNSQYDDDGNINEYDSVYIVKEIRRLKIIDVKYTDRKNKENTVFEVHLESGWIKEQLNKYMPKWRNTERDFIVKTSYNKDGNRILKGADKGRNLNAPKDEDWTLLKLKAETELSSFNLKNSTHGVASYIYNALLENPLQKIKGDLITVIERKYYRDELEEIFKSQRKFHPELDDSELYKKAITLLYPHNLNHRRKLEGFITNQPFSKLITEDVILYQRDLKSKKSLIADCVYEKENYGKVNFKTSQEFQQPLKAIHKANPLYQEFRIWQFIKRLKIIQFESIENDVFSVNIDVSKNKLTKEVKEGLFQFLSNKEHITQSVLLKHLGLSPKEFKWNYEADHKEPCNETRYNFILRMNRVKKDLWKTLLTPENEYRIWHFFYSVKKQEEFKTGIKTLFRKLLEKSKLPSSYTEDLVRNFISFSGYTNDYGSYSEKALKKLLPFLRIGKYWEASKDQVEATLNNIDYPIKKEVLSIEEIQGELTDFQGLWISSACYIVYNRYSEVGDVKYWTTPYHIENYIQNEFKQHSLNSPVVERVLRETLQMVKDIWISFAEQDGKDNNGKIIYKTLFDRIHIELGREMKKNAKERKMESDKNNENKKSNERIIELLKELKRENTAIQTKSPYQQEKLKIIEDGLLSSIEYDKDATIYSLINSAKHITKKEIREITSKDINKISKSDFERYKLWLDQRYQSPYTGKVIKLSDLFNREKYQIEHIFPQERITLNAYYNKVICETEVNTAKKAITGYQFILNCNGEKKIECAAHGDNKILILSPEDYVKNVKKNFTDVKKQEILLSKDIPSEFSNSQLNNARFISKMVMKLMSNIVREKGEDSFRSKNVLPINGVITTKLKHDWQLNDAWNELIQPRFERLNKLTNSKLFGEYRKFNGHDIFTNRIPEELNKEFDKKRIDHRHHALDALVIALATENHVNYLNNISSQNTEDKKLKERFAIKEKYIASKKNDEGDKSKFFLPPAQYKKEGEVIQYSYLFSDFKSDVFKEVALEALLQTIVSFKQKKRIIKQRTNKFKKWNSEKDQIEKTPQKELNKKNNYYVRMALHTSMPYGKKNYDFDILNIADNINKHELILDNVIKQQVIELFGQYDGKIGEIQNHLKKHPIQNSNGELASVAAFKIITEKFRKRLPISKLSDRGNGGINNLEDAKKLINKVADFQLRFDLLKHLEQNNNDIDIAFSSDGIDSFNLFRENRVNRLPIAERGEKRFSLGQSNFTNHKWVENEAGSNQFCGFYCNDSGFRDFIVPPLKETVKNLKEGNSACPENILNEKSNEEYRRIFILTPNDLVYMPTEDEIKNPSLVNQKYLSKEQIGRIYKFTDGNSHPVMYFMPYFIASTIVNIRKDDFKKMNLPELTFEDKSESIKGTKSKMKELLNELGLGSKLSKSQNTIDGKEMIRNKCWKLDVNRLGIITNIYK